MNHGFRWDFISYESKRTRENCYRLLDTIRTYTGYISEPQIVAETGTSDDYLVEIRGEVNKSDKGWHHLEHLIYAPEHERSLETLQKDRCTEHIL